MIKAKKAVQDLSPYQNGNHNMEVINNHRRALKLDSNEATIGPSPKVVSEVASYVQNGPLHLYPDVESAELREALTKYTNEPKENILTFNGSDHGLETIARCFLEKGDHVLQFYPTYDHFRVYVESCDATLRSIRESDQVLVEALKENATLKTKMIYLVNPNNPTGKSYSLDEIKAALDEFRHCLFILDEAYYEFSKMTGASLLKDYDNLIITRSFSKAFGMASLRCGYVLAQSSLIEQLEKIRVGKNINALAQLAATAALSDLDYVDHYIEEVSFAKEWIIGKFRGLGLEVKDTPANYILLKVEDPNGVIKKLEEDLVFIRNRSNLIGLEKTVRITVGDLLSMKRFWYIFKMLDRELIMPQDQNVTVNIRSK